MGEERGEGPHVREASGHPEGPPWALRALASPPASVSGGAGPWLNIPRGRSHTRENPKPYTPGPPPTPASLASGWHGDRAGDKVRRISRPLQPLEATCVPRLMAASLQPLLRPVSPPDSPAAPFHLPGPPWLTGTRGDPGHPHGQVSGICTVPSTTEETATGSGV